MAFFDFISHPINQLFAKQEGGSILGNLWRADANFSTGFLHGLIGTPQTNLQPSITHEDAAVAEYNKAVADYQAMGYSVDSSNVSSSSVSGSSDQVQSMLPWLIGGGLLLLLLKR